MFSSALTSVFQSSFENMTTGSQVTIPYPPSLHPDKCPAPSTLLLCRRYAHPAGSSLSLVCSGRDGRSGWRSCPLSLSIPWLPEAVVQPVEGDSLVVELTVLVWLLPRSRAWDKDLGAGGLFETWFQEAQMRMWGERSRGGRKADTVCLRKPNLLSHPAFTCVHIIPSTVGSADLSSFSCRNPITRVVAKAQTARSSSSCL